MLGTSADRLGKHVADEVTETLASFAESAVTHLLLAMALSLQTMVSPTGDGIVERQGCFRTADGIFAVDETAFLGVA